jgi:hypothetical protein
MFKQMWDSVLGLQGRVPFALALDEQRALYALSLSRPHVPAHVREAIALAWRSAKSERECAVVEGMERAAVEKWSLDHIERLSSIDPDYPAAYARGVAAFQGHHFAAAAEAFRTWLGAHPDGALALRARSYLRSASLAAQVE